MCYDLLAFMLLETGCVLVHVSQRFYLRQGIDSFKGTKDMPRLLGCEYVTFKLATSPQLRSSPLGDDGGRMGLGRNEGESYSWETK